MTNSKLTYSGFIQFRPKSSVAHRLINGWPADGHMTSFVWAVAVATLYILIPWESMSTRPKFADIDNYLAMIRLVASEQLSEVENIFSWFFSEPGWTLILRPIALYADDPLQGLLLISWLSAIVFLWFMHRFAGSMLALIVIFNPLVIDLVFSQVRSASALALLLMSFGCRNRLLKLVVVLYACTVHSVSLILIGCYVVAVALECSSMLQTRIFKGIACIGVAVVLAWALSYGRESLFSAVGDRRAEYDVDPGSVLFVSFWMFWALTETVARSKLFRCPWHWSEGIVIMLFSLAFFMSAFSTNGIRFISLALPLLACTLSLARPALKFAGTTALIVHQTVQFVYWY